MEFFSSSLDAVFPLLETVFPLLKIVYYPFGTVFPLFDTVFLLFGTVFPLFDTVFPLFDTVFPLPDYRGGVRGEGELPQPPRPHHLPSAPGAEAVQAIDGPQLRQQGQRAADCQSQVTSCSCELLTVCS